MSTNAKVYASVLLALGFFVLSGALVEGWLVQATKFAAFLALAVLASGLSVGMPGVAGSTSFAYLFAIIGFAELSLPETLVISAACILIEGLWHVRKAPTLLQLLLSVAIMSVAVFCGNLTFHSAYLLSHNIPMAARLLLAAIVFFITNTFATASLSSLTDRKPLLKRWRAQYFWSFPFYIAAAAVSWAFRETSETLGWQAAILILPLAHLFGRAYSLNVGRLEDGKIHAEQMASVHLRTIESLALAIEAKDNTTHDHLKRVQVYAMELAHELGLSIMETEALRAAALLHDIGKLAVPEYIISKPGRLTPEEFEKMKIHTVVGAEILEHVQFPYPVVPIVRAHHEKWNGTGYPMGLRGTDIPIGARILSAVDALDALASDRQYRRALPLAEAMSKIEMESGRSFDPKVVEVLKKKYVELERKAHSANTIGAKLSTDLRIERGEAPATGFESAKIISGSDDDRSGFLHSAAIARRELKEIFDIGLGSESPLSLDEIIAVLGVRLKKLIPFDAIALYTVEDDKLIPEYVNGDNYRLFSSLQIPMGQGLSGWVAENKKPIMNGNPSVEPGYLNNPSIFSTLRSALAVPLEGSKSVIGVLSLYHEGKDAFTKDHLRLIETIGPKLALSLELASRQPEGDVDNEPADYLTGLPDGRAFFQNLEAELVRCKRLNTCLGVIVCTVEGLTHVNRKLGRMEGDRMLRAVAAALRTTCSEFDYIAQLSADEFAVLLPGVRKDSMEAKVARLMTATPRSGKHALSLIAGQSSYPDDGSDAEHLISEADRRMFQVKQHRDLSADDRKRMDAMDEMNWLQ